MKTVAIAIVLWMVMIVSMWCLDDAFDLLHNAFSVEVHPILYTGGILYSIDVVTSSALQNRHCLVHFNDSSIYLNYDVHLAGESSAFVEHPIKGAMEYFEIGRYSGMQPVITNKTYVDSFNLPTITCIIGLGDGNTILPNFRFKGVMFEDKSNDAEAIDCEWATNELCRFPATIRYRGSTIGTLPVSFADFSPTTTIPVDFFNQLYLSNVANGNKWDDIIICPTSTSSCFSIPARIISLTVHEYEAITVVSSDSDTMRLGMSVLIALDVAYEQYATLRVKQHAIPLNTTMGFSILTIIMTIIGFFFLASPPIMEFTVPSGFHSFASFKMLVSGLVLSAPFGLLIADNVFKNLLSETQSFVYYAYTVQGVFTTFGLFSLLFQGRWRSLDVFAFYLPIISIWNFCFYASLIDFTEGDPAWGQVFLFQFVNVLIFALCTAIYNHPFMPKTLKLLLFTFWTCVALSFSVWTLTLFMIPWVQQLFEMYNYWVILFYPIFVRIYILLGYVVYAGHRSLYFYVEHVMSILHVRIDTFF